MYGDALSLLDAFFCHQAKCDNKGVDFDRNFGVGCNLLPIDVMAHFVFASGIADAVAVEPPGSGFQGEFVEVAEVLGFYGVFYIDRFRNARERQKGVDGGNDVVADEEVECDSSTEVEQIDGDESIIKIVRLCVDTLCTHIPFKRNFSLLRYDEVL